MNSNRINSIDGLRGFALLGILIVNMMHFQYGSEHIAVISSYPFFSEELFYGIRILFQGSFLTIFAFLFGFSIMQFSYSRERKLLTYKLPLMKRGLALLTIGLIHYIFIWPGDILASYGIMVLFVMLLVKLDFKVLKILIYTFLPVYILLNFSSRLFADGTSNLTTELKNNLIYSTGTLSEVFSHRLTFGLGEVILSPIINFILHLFNVVTIPMVLIPFALYGMYVSKQQLENVKKFEVVSYKIWIPITVIGIALKFGLLLGNWLGMLLLTVGSILTTYGYIHMYLAVHQKLFSSKVKLVFEHVGKMTISNYLAQSVILTLVFSGYGLGLSGKLGLIGGFIVALALFTVQGLTSYYIIKKYKQGPMEYLIRKIIYTGDNKAKTTASHDISS